MAARTWLTLATSIPAGVASSRSRACRPSASPVRRTLSVAAVAPTGSLRCAPARAVAVVETASGGRAAGNPPSIL